MSAHEEVASPAMRPTFDRPRPSAIAYLQLLRLPNVFTAAADIMLGFVFTHGDGQPSLHFGLLIAASCCTYLAGMALNDFFDRDIDAVERPGRPIPSGRIAAVTAGGIGFGLLAMGLALAWAISGLSGKLRVGLVATALAGAVLLYDRWLKRTPLGPLGMGACRTLNVLLGMSAMDGPWEQVHLWIAGAIGLYIIGVTWFARTEATESNRVQLALATAVMLAGIGLLARYPYLSEDLLGLLPDRWELFWGVLAALIGWRCVRAIADPRPTTVQTAVKNAILSLIILDGAAVLPVGGMYWAIAIVLLMVPTMILGYWVYST